MFETSEKLSNKIETVSLYARVSTEEQKENFSLGSQKDILRKHAADHKCEIYDEYIDDGYSGTSQDRPNFQRLMADARARKFNSILVYRIDRFFRSNKDLLNIADELEGLGISIKSVSEPFDSSTFMGKFMLSMFGSVAELERNAFMERSKLGKLKRAREGYHAGCSPKYGYNYNPETKKLEINEEEAKVVSLIFLMYNEGDSSLVKVARKIKAFGYRTRKGNYFETDRVHDIIIDPIYTGRWYANRFDSKTNGLKPREEWIEVSVPKIIPDKVFDKVQQLRKARSNSSTRNAKHKYLLQGVCKCGDCGLSLTGTTDKVSKKNGKRYGPYGSIYYRCSNYVRNKIRKVIDCKLKWIRGEMLEPAIWNEIEKIFRKPELIKRAVKRQEKGNENQQEVLQSKYAKLEKEKKSLETEEQRILEAYRQGAISVSQLKDQMDVIADKRRIFCEEESKLRSRLKVNNGNSLQGAINFLKAIKKSIKRFDYKTKKKLLRMLNVKAIVNIDGGIDIKCILPLIPEKSATCLPLIASAIPI